MSLKDAVRHALESAEAARHLEIMDDIEAGNREAHRLYAHFPEGIRYRYFEAGTIDDVRHFHCYSSTRNAAGYFMTWQESIRADGTGWRHRWRAHERKSAAISLARGLARADKAKRDRAA